MSEKGAFLERVLAGDVLDPDEEIDDAVDEWHGAHTAVPLHSWLGMTHDEYCLWLEQPNALRAILQARRFQLPVHAFVASTDNATALAARGASSEELAELKIWLKKTGRL